MSVSAAEPEAETRKKRHLTLWQELVVFVALALVLAVVIKTFLVQVFYVPSESMENTLLPNDRIAVEKISGWTGGHPQRGDVVVFADPGGWLNASQVRTADGVIPKALEAVGLYPTGGFLVKRVIGVGGDTVRCCDSQDRILVNGHPLNETSYLRAGEQPSQIPFNVHVRPGFIWVQGDNRSDSEDSRFHRGQPGGGAVPAKLVVGKVVALIWPWSHARTFTRPPTFASVGPPRDTAAQGARAR